MSRMMAFRSLDRRDPARFICLIAASSPAVSLAAFPAANC